MNPIETLSDAELAYLAVDTIPAYNLVIKNERVNVYNEVFGLFEADYELSAYYRERILMCIRKIIEIQGNEIEEENRLGFDYPNRK